MLNIDCLVSALQAAHARILGPTGSAPPLDTEGYHVLAEEVARIYEATLNTLRRAEATGLERAPVRPIGPLRDALLRAYSTVQRATHVLRRAGVDVTQLRTDVPVATLWTDAVRLASDRGQLDAIVAVALGDPSVRAHHDTIRAAV